MILIIVESPAKCKKIEGFLGKNYKCIASFGHFREFTNGLKSIGVQKGDRVTIYLTMIPELAYVMLACARIGAILYKKFF